MRFKFLIIPSLLAVQSAFAQNSTPSATLGQGTVTPVTQTNSASPVTPTDSQPVLSASSSTETAIIDYKSVYEAATIEEEVKMAAERFSLTPAQQDVWLTAAKDRRETEKKAREQLDPKNANPEKGAIYKGLKASQVEFYETIIGYLNPAQKQALETDRIIMEEKRKRLAKIPPPPPPPTFTVAPVDSAAIKEAEKAKGTGKKSKKKKKPAGA
jgi:hypothetical protein